MVNGSEIQDKSVEVGKVKDKIKKGVVLLKLLAVHYGQNRIAAGR
jgi:hypothetical protein